MSLVAIVDYDMGNVDSVARAVEESGVRACITSEASVFEEATAIILPGVGSFGDGMDNIKKRGLVDILEKQVFENKVPFLGICLGMQLLAQKGYEGGEHAGLGWIDGEIIRLEPKGESLRIPHIGWNEVNYVKEDPFFNNIESGKDFYFVHSYYFHCQNSANILATTPYCGEFVCAVKRDNIYGVQFHPEKSQKTGQQLLKNFLTSQASVL